MAAVNSGRFGSIAVYLRLQLMIAAMAAVGVYSQSFAHVHAADSDVKTEFHSIALNDTGPQATLQLMYCDSSLKQRPAILMLGVLKRDAPPAWSVDLLREGYVLVTFQVAHPPDPDPRRRPEWLVFDQRFAHSYVPGGARAPHDAGRVIDYLIGRGDIDPKKIG